MAQFEQWFDQDFTEKIDIRHCESVMFSGDDKGAVVGVHLFNGGAEYAGGGTVSGKVIRSDGAEVALTGTISGNAVYVELLESCLAVPGPIGVYIRLTADSQKATVLSAVYTVQATSTGTIVDPGTIIPSVNDLIDDIEQAVSSIPADYTALLAAVAPTFSATAQYHAGYYVWYNGELYQYKVNHDAGAWDAAQAVKVPLSKAVGEMQDEARIYQYLTNNGQYTVTASDMENGGWGYSNKVQNTKRVRNANLIPIRAGMQIAYSNPTLKVAFSVLATKTSTNSYAQLGSWIAPGGSGVVNITKDGYLVFLCESADSSDITINDYDCTVVITTMQKDETEKILTTSPFLFNLSGLYGLPYNPTFDFSISDSAGNALLGFKSGTLYVPNISSLNFVGKTVSIIGDSISTYSGYLPEGYAAYYPRSGNDIDNVNKTWWKQLIDETGLALLKNASWSGSGVCGDSTNTTGVIACSDKRINDVAGDHGEHPDLILIYITTNDWGLYNREIGTFTSQSGIPAGGTITKITEAYALMLYKLRTTYPLAKIFCILNLEGRLTENDTQYPIVNSKGETIHEVNHAISEVAHIFGAKTIDLETSGITFWNVGNYTGDGTLHPNAAGAIIIKDTVKKALISAL